MPYITKSLTVIITLLGSLLEVSSTPGSYRNRFSSHEQHYTKPISLKQGDLRGVVVEVNIGGNERRRVSVFKGIQYAAPPTGNLRFMPPSDAPPWFGIKRAVEFGPVCPQKFPDEKSLSEFTNFFRLKQYLLNESEDCLNLNIYAPYEADPDNSRRYPVMVFIHGESFEWNSGNPYDGSVLAAYGEVIVITINFRLGILGFLQTRTPGIHFESNFGLVDQIGALVWIRDNIGAFGGDNKSVTVFGHGTGAVCASLLMTSPMIMKETSTLFHRAILMGGTALSDWAFAGNPTAVRYQISNALNCQIDEDFAECLRKKSLAEIMAADAISPDYKIRFGPVIDSLVVPNEPKKSMTEYNDLFQRFELMYGVAEIESINLLGPVAVRQGMLGKERDRELYAYFRIRCEMKPNICLERTQREYSDDYEGHESDEALLARNTVLDILSDARSVAPIVQMARYHAALNSQSYFYVFTHKTLSKEYIRHKSYTGEELPYVFGVPLGGPKFHFVDKYTKEEQMLSEIVMMYFSNFARTGDPNMPRRQTSYSMSLKQWAQFDVDWPEFDTQEERFIELGILPKPSNHYRERKMKYWNRIFPNLGNKSIPEVLDTSHISERTPQILNRIRTSPKNKYENFNKPFKSTSSGDFGIVTMIGERKPDNMEEGEFGIIVDSPPEEVKQSSTSNIVTIVCVLFLIVNLFLLVVLYFKCYRNKASGDSPTNTIEVSEDKGQKKEETFLVDGCNIIRMMNRSSGSNDTYKAVRASTTPKYKLSRERSGSTIDAHTKVREWIAQEIIHKYSPRFFRRSEPDTMKVPVPDKFIVPVSEDKESTLGRSPTRPVSPVEQKYIPMKTSTVRRHKFKVPKVSVAVDATPFGRGPSVLMQQPIEFTKSLDYPNVEPEIELPLRRSSTLEDFSSKTTNKEKKLTKSSTSVHMNLPEMEPTIIKISHYHSKSDPVRDLDYTAMKRLKTFDPNQSVNVTYRDEDKCPIPLTPEESLDTIKRRNFPKVLPDHPGKKVLTKKRLSMPTHGFNVPIGYPSSFFPSDPAMEDSHNKFPPAPPPRASTLVKQSSSPLPVFISEPSLAEEPEEEPEIVCNNFYVGPLIPKRQLGKTFETHGSLGDIKSMKPIEYISNKCGIVIPDEQKQNFKDMSDENNDNSISSECKIDHRVEIQTEPGVQCTKSNKSAKKSQIPTLVKTSSINKESSSSDSTPSEESDTGTIVKKT